jgi:hypothetical protein
MYTLSKKIRSNLSFYRKVVGSIYKLIFNINKLLVHCIEKFTKASRKIT